VRVVAVGDRIQAWLDGTLQLGLWTKADSITAFDDLKVHGQIRGG
jgi:hypothetical protein